MLGFLFTHRHFNILNNTNSWDKAVLKGSISGKIRNNHYKWMGEFFNF
jgi:hypothetical protein